MTKEYLNTLAKTTNDLLKSKCQNICLTDYLQRLRADILRQRMVQVDGKIFSLIK